MVFNHSEDYYLKKLFEDTKISEVMISPVLTINVNQKLSEALMIFGQHHVSHLIVVNDKDKVVGILTPKYIYRTQAPRKYISYDDVPPAIGTIFDGDSFYTKETLDSYFLKNVMSTAPFTLIDSNLLSEAIINMFEKHLSCIPIVDSYNKVKGVLTDKEIIGFVAKAVKG